MDCTCTQNTEKNREHSMAGHHLGFENHHTAEHRQYMRTPTCNIDHPSCTCDQWYHYMQHLHYYQQYHQQYQKTLQQHTQKREKAITKVDKPMLEELEEVFTNNEDHDVDEKLKDFFKRSKEHKIRVQEMRTQQSKEQLEQVKYQHPGNTDRSERLKCLYGDNIVEVMRREAKMSLLYEKYCDENQPVLWPVLPIRLR